MRQPDRHGWNNSLCIGHNVIDGHHKGLFDFANSLLDCDEAALLQRDGEMVLCHLIEYTQLHFSFEESVMLKVDYPLCAEHVVEHWQFINKLTDMTHQYEAGCNRILHTCSEHLVQWLTTHISETIGNFLGILQDNVFFIPASRTKNFLY